MNDRELFATIFSKSEKSNFKPFGKRSAETFA
jgi:hypothetical protein